MNKEECINLNTTINWLETNSDGESLKDWIKEDEDSATISVHHSIGRDLRNQLGLWTRDEDQTEIAKYFNSIGIYHADDMSNIILTSFHKKLNNKPLELNDQVDEAIKYWDENDPKINTGKF